VGSVAIDATRRQWVAALGRFSVEAFRVLLLLVGMARPAIYRLQFLWMRNLL
jgi:hypothetical protein